MVYDEGNRLVGVLGARTVQELKSEKAFNSTMAGFPPFFGRGQEHGAFVTVSRCCLWCMH